MVDGSSLSMYLTHLEAKWHKHRDIYDDGHVEDYEFHTKDGNYVGRVRMDHKGPRIVNAAYPDIMDNDPKRINSQDGKKREVSEEEKRRNRDRRRQLAEAHAHDDVEEAQRKLEAVKRSFRAANVTFGSGMVLALGTSAIAMIMFSWVLAIPIILGITLAIVGGIGTVSELSDRHVYKEQKNLREAEHRLRDVLTRPFEHYDASKLGE